MNFSKTAGVLLLSIGLGALYLLLFHQAPGPFKKELIHRTTQADRPPALDEQNSLHSDLATPRTDKNHQSIIAANERAMSNKTVDSQETGHDYQQWKNKAGFPSQADYELFSELTLDELIALAESGNLKASIRAGQRLFAQGRVEEARQLLFDAASKGSIAAASLLRDFYSGFIGDNGLDRSEAEAWSRISQAMGNPPDAFGPPSLSPEEGLIVEALFQLYWRELQRRHEDLFGTPLPYLPQPSGQRFVEALTRE